MMNMTLHKSITKVKQHRFGIVPGWGTTWRRATACSLEQVALTVAYLAEVLQASTWSLATHRIRRREGCQQIQFQFTDYNTDIK